MELKQGLYEQVINGSLNEALETLPKSLAPETEELDKVEAATILAAYLSQQALDILERKSVEGLDSQIRIVNRMLKAAQEEQDDRLVLKPARQLLSLRDTTLDRVMGRKRHLMRPETSLAQSSLFTGSHHEPGLDIELRREIASSDRIEMLVSFIKWSGVRLLLDNLREFTNRGGILRIITTTYIGATDPKAVDELSKLPNTEIRVSYDSAHTRLHAKAYLFHRDTGFTTAYVGSSNISHPALTSGLEWNMKITLQDQPTVIAKMQATFDSYWESQDYEPYDSSRYDRLSKAIDEERHPKSIAAEYVSHFLDVRPFPYQQDILDKLRAEREVFGRYRNLIVAATGTGKTVISALDYRNWCLEKNAGIPVRLLFVAHREEILSQSLSCFRTVMKDADFGNLLVGGFKPSSLDHLFVSIQSLNSTSLTEILPSDYYDYIVVDEFHHAAAKSYQQMLDYFRPQVLLGLTATPERHDGNDILSWFDNRIAAEIRLPEAIDRKLLCPFHYFGISDDTNLSQVRWLRGGYDKTELENVFVFSRETAKRRANAVISATIRYVTDINDMRALGFCVSKEHARFMAERFTSAGIPCVALTSDSDAKTRRNAQRLLITGEIKAIFTVDLYNEGVDIPEVNTVLFLRPTESLTVFLQQLGRGLRLSPETGKDCLTVLDFIGQANKLYRFEEKFAVLLPDTSGSVKRAIENEFAFLPKGCYIHLEKKAQEYVLENIRKSLGMKPGLIARIRTFEDESGEKLNLTNFLSYHHLDIRAIHAKNSFARLCVEAGVRDDYSEPDEKELTAALSHMCSMDSRRWIRFVLRFITLEEERHESQLSSGELRMLSMFQVTLWPKSIKEGTFATHEQWLERLLDNPTMHAEIVETLKWQLNRIDFVDELVDMGFDCPLDLHCSYTRDQIFVAMDVRDPQSIREGVRWVPGHSIDVLMNTLNKAERDYSPTTMYQDYSISDRLFHWQSQSTTSEASKTGQRYIHHREMGSRVALFVREYKKDSFGLTEAFCFLGLVEYRSHKGERPMSIIWKLEKPIPARYLNMTNKLAG